MGVSGVGARESESLRVCWPPTKSVEKASWKLAILLNKDLSIAPLIVNTSDIPHQQISAVRNTCDYLGGEASSLLFIARTSNVRPRVRIIHVADAAARAST